MKNKLISASLFLLLMAAVACTQPVEQPLEGQELINKFSGRWEVYNVESGEYEFNYWVIEPSGLCYLVNDAGWNDGNLVSDTAGEFNGNDVTIGTNGEDGPWVSEDNPYGGIKASTGKFYYSIGLQASIGGRYANHLDYYGNYIDSLDIFTNKDWVMDADNVYSGGLYELHRMKR